MSQGESRTTSADNEPSSNSIVDCNENMIELRRTDDSALLSRHCDCKDLDDIFQLERERALNGEMRNIRKMSKSAVRFAREFDSSVDRLTRVCADTGEELKGMAESFKEFRVSFRQQGKHLSEQMNQLKEKMALHNQYLVESQKEKEIMYERIRKSLIECRENCERNNECWAKLNEQNDAEIERLEKRIELERIKSEKYQQRMEERNKNRERIFASHREAMEKIRLEKEEARKQMEYKPSTFKLSESRLMKESRNENCSLEDQTQVNKEGSMHSLFNETEIGIVAI